MVEACFTHGEVCTPVESGAAHTPTNERFKDKSTAAAVPAAATHAGACSVNTFHYTVHLNVYHYSTVSIIL